MSITSFNPGSVIIAGGGSCPLDKFDPVISVILASFNVISYKSLIISQEWSKEGDRPHSPLWLFDNKPEMLCKNMILVCEEAAKEQELGFVVIDRRNIGQPVEAYTASDVFRLHSLAKELNVMILFIPNIKDADLDLTLFTDTFRCQVGMSFGYQTLDERCEVGTIDRDKYNKMMAEFSKRLKMCKDL